MSPGFVSDPTVTFVASVDKSTFSEPTEAESFPVLPSVINWFNVIP
jgi:hypothetical protein